MSLAPDSLKNLNKKEVTFGAPFNDDWELAGQATEGSRSELLFKSDVTVSFNVRPWQPALVDFQDQKYS